ncbi:MAG: hypothetical protein ACP5SI_02720 [Chloroflexia bacterium]
MPSGVQIAAWTAMGLGAVLIFSLLLRGGQALWRRFQPVNVWARYAEEASPYRRRRGRALGCLGVALWLLAGVGLAGAGWGLLTLDKALGAYAPLPSDGVAAGLRCWPGASEPPGTMGCQLTVESPVYSDTLSLRGSRWGLEGEVLVWDPRLEPFGLRSGFRLLRVVGLGLEGEPLDQVLLPGSSGGVDVRWLRPAGRWFFYQRQFLEGEAVPNRFYEVTVSRNGFALRSW